MKTLRIIVLLALMSAFVLSSLAYGISESSNLGVIVFVWELIMCLAFYRMGVISK